MHHDPYDETPLGRAYLGDSLALMQELPAASVNLAVTSPPFALVHKKAYGNKDQAEYVDWFCRYAREVYRLLPDDGSFVLDSGGAWRCRYPHPMRPPVTLSGQTARRVCEETLAPIPRRPGRGVRGFGGIGVAVMQECCYTAYLAMEGELSCQAEPTRFPSIAAEPLPCRNRSSESSPREPSSSSSGAMTG